MTRGLASGVKRYINGNLDATDTADTNLLGDSTQVVLGVSLYHYGVVGIVDDVQLYSSVLTPDEIQYLHDNPGLVLSGSGSGTTASVWKFQPGFEYGGIELHYSG